MLTAVGATDVKKVILVSSSKSFPGSLVPLNMAEPHTPLCAAIDALAQSAITVCLLRARHLSGHQGEIRGEKVSKGCNFCNSGKT